VLTILAVTPSPDTEPSTAIVERLATITTLDDLKDKLDEHEFLRDRYIILPNVSSGGKFDATLAMCCA
jgi:type III restriction enzyme